MRWRFAHGCFWISRTLLTRSMAKMTDWKDTSIAMQQTYMDIVAHQSRELINLSNDLADILDYLLTFSGMAALQINQNRIGGISLEIILIK